MREIWRIIRFSGSLWRYYALVGLFTVVVAAISQLIPLLTKGAVDEVTKVVGGGQANVRLVFILALLIFLTDIGQTFFGNIGGYLGDMLSAKQQRLLSRRYYEHIMSLPQAYFDRELTGKIINRMNRGITQIADFTQVFSNNFLQFIFSTVFTLIIVAYYSPVVAMILLSFYPIFIFMTARTSKKWQRYQKKINRNLDIASGRFAETIGQIKVVKSFVKEAYELNYFNRFMNKVVRTTRPQSRYWHEQDVWRRSVLAVINFGLYAYIFVETARGNYTIGTMVLLIQYAQLVRIPLFSISFLVDRTQRAISNTKDYFAAMDEAPEIRDRRGARRLAVTKGEVAFEGVNFSYDKKVPVLKNVGFTVRPDTKIALVGESGEGKTTITSLLLRLYEADGGAITIDGQNINDVTQASLRENIGVVFQEPALFSGTIRENIAYARPDAPEEDIVLAAKAANAHEFIEKFDKGYDAEIGERGLKLSGGQKQRLAIARALLKDAPILILDEATSSLDNRSERQVQQALERLMRGRTTIIIAHRLSTIQTVDSIVTLKNGTVDEIGSPDELAVSGGVYSGLLELQRVHTEATEQKLKAFGIKG